MLSAAAVMASSAANAGNPLHSFQFGTGGGGSYCDGGTAYSSGTSIWSWQHTNNNCGGAVSWGQGLVGKMVAGTVIGANMSDNIFARNYGSNYFVVSFTLPKKLKNGKPWELWCDFTGTTSFECNSGVLINVVAGHKGHTSTTSKLAAYIKSRG
jgi:hypothetical protein